MSRAYNEHRRRHRAAARERLRCQHCGAFLQTIPEALAPLWGVPIIAKRASRRYCSNRCRAAAFRQRRGPAPRREDITAQHEAAHAVARHVLGLPFLEITLGTAPPRAGPAPGPKDYAPGRILWAERPLTSAQAKIDEAITLLAGAAAEAHRAKSSLSAKLRWGGSNDNAEVAALWAGPGYTPDMRARFRAEAEKRAHALVRENWPLICRVAEVLIERGRLSYEEFREIAG